MQKFILGLHHVTALSSDPQKTYDFYRGILGLRLVKKTINFDAPEVYHLYFGNKVGSPGTILTFFPYVGLPQGTKGKGQLTVTSFSVPQDSLEYWAHRLTKHSVKHSGIQKRFENETYIYFEDNDGLGLELVVDEKDDRIGFDKGNISLEYAIKGFFGITLSEECIEKTADLLVGKLDHTLIAVEGNRYRYSTGTSTGFVDILCQPDILRGLAGSGTVHHVAFATENDSTQLLAREKLLRYGLNITPVLDRQYFRSVYFREPGGVLFEIATISPGFLIDETIDHLGESLQLPPWEEHNRKAIEKGLLPIYTEHQKGRT